MKLGKSRKLQKKNGEKMVKFEKKIFILVIDFSKHGKGTVFFFFYFMMMNESSDSPDY